MCSRDALGIVLDKCCASTLVMARLTCIDWCEICGEDTASAAARLRALPKGFAAEGLARHNRLTLAFIEERRCSLCMQPYRGKVDSIFGSWAHPKCRKSALVNTHYLPDALVELTLRSTFNETRVSTGLTLFPVDFLQGWNPHKNMGNFYHAVWRKRHWSVPVLNTWEGLMKTDTRFQEHECMQ